METVSVPLSLPVFKRLQTYVEPIIDDQNSALTRIFDHWDATAAAKKAAPAAVVPSAAKTHFKTSRGVMLPVGLNMFASWLDHSFRAVVKETGIECNGKLYDDPSGAAKAMKLACGASETTASTNGWTFWMMDSPNTKGKIRAINYFRGKK